MGDAGTRITGREAELAALTTLLEPAPTTRVQLLLGDPGLGKTVLLEELARRAAPVARTLRATGHESEARLAHAGLHQLLLPVLDRVDALPAPRAAALRAAYGEGDGPADPLLVGLAVLDLLTGLSAEGPVVVLVDDAQWWDGASLDALRFAVRRTGGAPLVVVLAARTPPAGGWPDAEALTLAPLDAGTSQQLLDALPDPPAGPVRRRVLAEAEGNPLALVELAAADRQPLGSSGAVRDRLSAVLAERFERLPAATRRALLLVAVADRATPLDASLLDAGAFAPAEAAGLVRVDGGGPAFRHPLVRRAVEDAVPFAELAAAHRAVAATLTAQPDRRAWHLAAAAVGVDEEVAALLEETAARARQRGGAAAAASALEQAARLTPPGPARARRWLAAAGLAQQAGRAEWVHELADQVLAEVDDPVLGRAAGLLVGWALAWSDQHQAALRHLHALLREAAPADPGTAWRALAFAATVAYQSGSAAERATVRADLAWLRTRSPDDQAMEQLAREGRLWAEACTAGPEERGDVVARLHQVAAGPVADLTLVGSSAWLLDETGLAVRLLREALEQVRAPGVGGDSGPVLSALQGACLDTGRWDEALAAADEARDVADARHMETVVASAELARAWVLGLRGDPAAVALAEAATRHADAAEYRSVAARARHVTGLVALGDGRAEDAWAALAPLFEPDGTPLHHHVSATAAADLAAAAARTGRADEAAARLGAALDAAGRAGGVRLRQVAARARALLTDGAAAGACFAEGLADPAGEAWPFERALLRLDHGEWLRRERRINDAKPELAAALATFRTLGAEPWVRRAQAELRACGVEAAAPAPDRLAALTTQQREVVRLAGQGLTNGEIAERLYLSPRTVASHLYRAYPKLGVAGRWQLRDVVGDVAGD